MTDLAALESELEELRARLAALDDAVRASFLGQDEVLEQVLVALLGGGHALLEGVPGLGKTTLVRSLAAGLDVTFRRIQFTPDLMPADVLGTRVLEEDERGRRVFTFQPGPIFGNVVLADEINRTTPRTQSALLEAMQEGSVTLHGETRPLPDPFLLIATENPIEMEGTYPLPEAQLDRFLLKIELGYPDREELERVLAATSGEPRAPVAAAMDAAQVRRLRELARQVPASSEIVQRVASIVLATHPDEASAPDSVRRHVRYGASPRGGQALLVAARARALLRGRLHVAAEDVEAVARPALRHRLILGYEGEAEGVRPDDLIADVLAAAG